MQGPVVITGGKGFVGQHLVRELQESAPETEIVIWDRPTVDITDTSTYRDSLGALQPAWIVHLAAFSAVGESFKQPEVVQHVNVEATRDLLELIVELSPATRVLAVSSSEIYGSSAEAKASADLPLPELPLSQARPNNPYAQSKLDMEKLIEESFNERVIRVRPFPHLGPGQQRGFVTADFASQIAAIESGKQEPRLKVGNLTTARDFTDVRDVVHAYHLLMEKGTLGEAYHVASGRAVSIQSILDQLLAMTNVDITVEQSAQQLRPKEVISLTGDTTKLRTATGWDPTIPLSQSLQDILTYWREQMVK
jgi:GDP-4-dehydro-6-deoxy-D-mannose reductase